MSVEIILEDKLGPDSDYTQTSIKWFCNDALFLSQKEKGTNIEHKILLDVSMVLQVRDHLNRFLNSHAGRAG